MIPHVFSLTAEMPALILSDTGPSTLVVDRIVFHTSDPDWAARLARAVLSVVTLVTEDDEENPTHHAMEEHVCPIGPLLRNTFTTPVVELEGGWSVTPAYQPVGDAAHLWSHALSMKETLELQEGEALEVTIRSTLDLTDYRLFLMDPPADPGLEDEAPDGEEE